MDIKKLINVAAGREKADIALKGASVLNVFTEAFEKLDVAIIEDCIAGLGSYEGETEIDVSGKIIIPGLIDGHIHLESTLLTPFEFQKASLPTGTTAVVADPHEIANVAGKEGIDYITRLTDDLITRVYFMMPSCVPASPLEESGAILSSDDLREYYSRDNVLGLAEVMNAEGVCSCDDDLLSKIEDAHKLDKRIDGHAPALSGDSLEAYIAAGVATDHECSAAAEAFEKLSRGQWIMVREGTAAKNMEALLPVCRPPYCHRAMFITDDRHPEDLLSEGHMNSVLKKAVSLGVSPITAVKMCTYNTALCFGLKGFGAVAPGYKADLVVVSDCVDFNAEMVFVGGKLVAENGELKDTAEPSFSKPSRIWSSFDMDKIEAESFKLPTIKSKLRVIELIKHELLTNELIVDTSEISRKRNGIDPENDILKIAVLERHHHTGHIGIGFVKGYGLKKGAVATSVAHDSHNIITVGENEEDMAAAGEAVRQSCGGIAVAVGGEVIASLSLPIGGLMSPLPAIQVRDSLVELKEKARELGVSCDIDPFMTLSFASLPVIPRLRVNGKGLIDTVLGKVVDVTFD